jgi:cell cycle checkpoint protein
MALQFALVVRLGGKKGKETSKGGSTAKVVLNFVTRREQSLALFHLIGKVLYNKREQSIELFNS